MTTRRQLERVIVHQAVREKAAHDQAEFFMRKLDNERHVGGELLRERNALVAENTELRADVEWLEDIVHRLADSRRALRRDVRYWHTRDVAALSSAVEDQLEIDRLRAELKRAKGRKR